MSGTGGKSASGGTKASGGAATTGGKSASGGVTSTGGATTNTSAGTPGQSGKFPSSSVFYQDISKAALDSESSKIMAALEDRGWGDSGDRTTMGIDFSFEINMATASVARRTFTQPSDALPDCDTAPIPLPAGGKIESSSNYACDDGDCHLIVYQGNRLYELYQANVTGGQATGGTFTGGCLVVWDMTRDYWQPAAAPNFSRGDGCNGADAADLPMAPLLVTKAELTAGSIEHALRFTISNNRIREAVYVHPATHLGGPTGDTSMPPYGARLRLRADYDLASLPNDAARTIARALQKYGMFLADGGNIYISATTDASGAINNSALGALRPRDFEMIEGGTRYNFHNQNCTRTPVSD